MMMRMMMMVLMDDGDGDDDDHHHDNHDDLSDLVTIRPAHHTALGRRETAQFAAAMEMFIPTLVRCRWPRVDR